MKHAVILLTLLLTGCTAAEQRITAVYCLDKCKDGNTECINACANLLKNCK